MPLPNFDIDKVIARQQQARRQKILVAILAVLAVLALLFILRGG